MEGSNDKDVAMIRTLWDQYGAEWSPGGDFERWMEMWVEDGIQCPPDAPRNVGKEQIRAGNQLGYEESEWTMNVYPEDIRVFGEEAYSRGTYEFAFTQKPTGKTFAGTGKFSKYDENAGQVAESQKTVASWELLHLTPEVSQGSPIPDCTTITHQIVHQLMLNKNAQAAS